MRAHPGSAGSNEFNGMIVKSCFRSQLRLARIHILSLTLQSWASRQETLVMMPQSLEAYISLTHGVLVLRSRRGSFAIRKATANDNRPYVSGWPESLAH